MRWQSVVEKEQINSKRCVMWSEGENFILSFGIFAGLTGILAVLRANWDDLVLSFWGFFVRIADTNSHKNWKEIYSLNRHFDLVWKYFSKRCLFFYHQSKVTLLTFYKLGQFHWFVWYESKDLLNSILGDPALSDSQQNVSKLINVSVFFSLKWTLWT